MIELPRIMIAPNGARRTKVDHPELPMTIDETVACARACYAAGADGIHAHVRDEQGKHVLDVGLYRELLAEMRVQVPGMTVQVTSEAAGRYAAHEQQAVIQELQPDYVSVAMREMLDVTENKLQREDAKRFYQWAQDSGVTIQHIIYSAEDVAEWFARVETEIIPEPEHTAQLLFVLGRYHKNQQSQPEDLMPFLATLKAAQGDVVVDWSVCAFGNEETACLLEAAKQGGKMRIGFENSLWHADGTLARDNRERVEYLLRHMA